MNAALRKEIRLLLPAWIAAMAAATLPVWAVGQEILLDRYSGIRALCRTIFAAGALFFSLSSFGLEMSLGTFPSLLSQPRPRLDTWQMKIGSLASALALVTLAAGFSWWLRVHTMLTELVPIGHGFYRRAPYPGLFSDAHICLILLLAVVAFAGGLWTTLLFRQTLTAFWIAIIAPFLLFWPWIRGLWDDYFALASCGYGLVGFFVARWLFLHAQDRQSNAVAAMAQWTLLPAFRRTLWPAAALFSKELRLQHGTLLVACVLALLDLAASAALKYCGHTVTGDTLVWACSIGWFFAALLVGCASIAEERQSHTLESALCLPVGRFKQFLIKLAVVFGLGIFLGAVLPWLLAQLRPELWKYSTTVYGLLFLVRVAAIITAVGCFASSLSRTLLQAFGAAILLAVLSRFADIVLGPLYIVLHGFRRLWLEGVCGVPQDAHGVIRPFFGDAFRHLPFISVSALIAILVCLSYGNFKPERIGWQKWFRASLVALAAIVLGLLLCFILGFIVAAIRH